jgi:hypothetical protein
MEQRDLKRKLLDEHLRYELDMFDEAARFLMSEQFKKLDRENTNNRDDWFRANAAIETFRTHARTLREFFTQKKNDEPVEDAAFFRILLERVTDDVRLAPTSGVKADIAGLPNCAIRVVNACSKKRRLPQRWCEEARR